MHKLYDFQESLVAKHVEVPFTLVGDDMGLGKTIEAIEIDRRKRERFAANFIATYKGKPLTLVVTPLTVTGSWLRHYREWAPHLKVMVIDPKNRPAFLNAVQQGLADVFVCHWEGLRMIEELRSFRWFHVIADEVHRAKNRKSQQTVALKLLHTDHKLGLSGTPADNRPDDFWSVLNWLYPKTFTSYNQFRNYHLIIKRHTKGSDSSPYCTAVGCEVDHRSSFDEIIGCAHVDELQRAIRPYYTRRLKEQVLDELPDKYHNDVFVDITPQQRRAYNEMRKHMLAWVGKHENEPIAAPIVLAQLRRLQQFACAYARTETVFRRKKDCKDPVCLANTLAAGKSVCSGHWVEVLRLEEPSSKLDAVMEIVMDNPTQQLVVFSQSRQMIDMLAKRLEKQKVPTAILTGDTPQGTKPGQRDDLVERFQQGDFRVFGSTIRAGGEGITLTASSHVVFTDRDWSPSKNNQAEDRCHRIGQKNAVQVTSIIANGTLEPKRNKQIEMKWQWLKEILGDEVPPE